MKPLNRLPGIYFEAQTGMPDEALPRMDIAAFVGFSRSGPIDTPVPVESVSQFRDIFGGDVLLNWDAVHTTLGYLGASIEAFFANGGIRCWVVRVANTSGDKRADTYQFPIENLFKLNINGDIVEIQDVVSPARSAGSWAVQWQVEAIIHLRALHFTDIQYANDWNISLRTTPELQLGVGELLKINLDDGTFWYGFVDKLDNNAGLLSLLGNWILVAEQQGSPAAEWSWEKRQPATMLVSPSVDVISIQQVRLDLLARHQDGQVLRVDNLAFSSRHSRFWGQLPNDHTLFARLQGELQLPIPAELSQLHAQAREPRFPLAGFDAFQAQNTEQEQHELLYLPALPVEMQGQATISAIVELSEDVADGLDELDAFIFLNGSNPDLNSFRLGALTAELEHRFYIQKQALKGLYSLLPIQEISLLSIPDLVHLSNWEAVKKINPEIPKAPRLTMLSTASGICLNWELMLGVYTLECADSAEFKNATVIYQGSNTDCCLASTNTCQPVQYYRVRVQYEHVISLWSNIVLDSPVFKQGDCSIVVKLSLYLQVDEVDTETNSANLHWATNLTEPLPALAYQIQESDNPDFTPVLREQDIEHSIPAHQTVSINPQTIAYFRIRAILNEEESPWSNAVQIVPDLTEDSEALPASNDGLEYHILAVHRAMLRFCTARQDILAILTLPAYNRERLLLHVNSLSSLQQNDQVTAGVLPFSSGELKALDYAAVFHPWLADSRSNGRDDKAVVQQTLPYMPCDGAICGSMADTANRFGAWVASANKPLADVLALHPILDRDDWQQLDAAQINLLRQDGRGFLLMNADTLSRSEENRPVNVRRLMILLRRLVLREGNRNVFEPDSIDFRNRIHHYFTRLLANLYSRGAFTGNTQEAAFRVVVDSSVNTRQSIDRGRFIVELQVAPSRPLEFLTVRLMQTGEETIFFEGVSNG